MEDADTLIVGYDIGNEYTQISCLIKKLAEPEQVNPFPDSKGCMIPTVLAKNGDALEWLFGEDALNHKNTNKSIYIDNLIKRLENYKTKTDAGQPMQELAADPEYLIEKFIARTLAMLRQKYFNYGIAKMALTSRNLNNDLRSSLYGILEKLGLKKDRVRVFNYTECFMYYVLSQKPEIWTNDVGLFDYGEEGLKFYQLTIGRKKKPSPVIVNCYDLGDEFSYSIIRKNGNSLFSKDGIVFYDENNDSLSDNEEVERMKYRFLDIASKLLHKRLISALYFTGQGFAGSWPDDVLKKLCMGRRVFKGQNLFTKGACYAAKIMKEGGMEEFFFLSEDQLSATVSLRVFKDSKNAGVIFAKTGDYYFDIDNTVDIILDNENTLDFTISSILKKDEIHAFLTLNDLPVRENKTICLSVNVSFADKNSAIVRVKDMGFLDIYKTSYRIWEFRLDI